MAKWVFDRVVAFFGLLFLWPVMVVIAAAVKLSMPQGKVFFCQERVGQHGRLFRLIKFRTMYAGMEGSSITVSSDKRISKTGAFLRKYKLDELPELWNVLKGDMSFVGPRPDVPGYADKLIDEDRKILCLKPGITGPASLKYRHEEQLLDGKENPIEYNDLIIWPDKVRINLEYYKNRSFFGDIKIIFMTLGLIK